MQVPPVGAVHAAEPYEGQRGQSEFSTETPAHVVQAEWARQPGPGLSQTDPEQQGSQGAIGPKSAGGNPAAQGWMEVYQDRMKRMQEATDPALKAHYQAELEVMKPTMKALGLETPGDGQQGGGEGQGEGAKAGGGDAGGSAGSTRATDGLSAKAQTGALSEAESQKVAGEYIANLQKDFGLTKEQATGIVANLFHESWGMNPGITQGGRIGAPNGNMADDNANGYGLAQWGGVRKQGLLNFAKANGLDPSSHAANYGFLKHELSGEYSSVIAAVKGTGTVGEATQVFSDLYLKPSEPRMNERLQIANSLAMR